jgi:hypothetical protein
MARIAPNIMSPLFRRDDRFGEDGMVAVGVTADVGSLCASRSGSAGEGEIL